MSETVNLGLPYIEAGQAQKHVTHNEALRTLDFLVNSHVIDRDLATPPASPAEGDIYIVATGATGDWSGHDGELTAFEDGIWMFQTLITGFVVWVEDETVLSVWNGSAWLDYAPTTGLPQSASTFGINATADVTNRLSVSSPAVLFNHEGSDIRQKLNKNGVGDTASLLYQTGYSGRAEMGLAGDDDFHIKVSPDGSNWFDAIMVDKDNGDVYANGSRVLTESSPGGGSTPPAFHGRETGGHSSASIRVIKPQTMILNSGNHFDNSTGIFTASQDGTYLFSMQILSTTNSPVGSTYIWIRKNGSAVAMQSLSDSNTGSNVPIFTQAIVGLVANDTIDFTVKGKAHTGAWTYVSGALLG